MEKVIVDKKALVRALGACRRTGAPSVTVEAAGDAVRLTAAGQHFAATQRLVAEGTLHAKTTVDLRRLSAYAGSCGPTVALLFDPFRVQSGSSLLTLPELDLEEVYPSVTEGECRVDGDAFRAAISRAVVAAGDDDTRPYTTGVNFDGARATCTDGHRLVRIDGIDVPALKGATVPARALAEVAALSGDLRVFASRGLARFVGLDGEIVARLVDCQYPDVESALPKGKPATTLELSPAGLAESLRRCTLANIGVSIRGAMALEAKSPEGTVADEVEAAGQAIADAVGVNGRYLAELLDVFDKPVVGVEFRGEDGPIVIKDGGDAMALVMPMRL